MPLSDQVSVFRAPRLRLIANGQVLTGALEAEVISNNYYAADRFTAIVALGPDPWADAAFWAANANILVDVQFSLDGANQHIYVDGKSSEQGEVTSCQNNGDP